MPRAFSNQERALLKARLIEIGKRMINRSGMKSLTIDDAARESGISKGSFYAFFPSREDFILSVFESWEEEFRTSLFEQVARNPGSARERLEAFFTGFMAIMEREPGLARTGFKEIQQLVERLPEERLLQHRARDERVINSLALSWASEGIISSRDIPALEGAIDSLYILAMHRDDFGPETRGPTMQLIVEALAMRLAQAAST